VAKAVETIKNSLDDLPGDPRTQFGLVTFDSTVHFYNLKPSLKQPQVMPA
jgi:protein transport protein SEC24